MQFIRYLTARSRMRPISLLTQAKRFSENKLSGKLKLNFKFKFIRSTGSKTILIGPRKEKKNKKTQKDINKLQNSKQTVSIKSKAEGSRQ